MTINSFSNRMHIGFDVSQTGSAKAGCGYFAHAMIQSLLDIAPEHQYSIFPSFGDFYFDAHMPLRTPYPKAHYGPRHLTREASRQFWTAETVELSLKNPDIIHSNNFWCPIQLQSSLLIYTFYDMGFLVNDNWTTKANRVGCFDGVFRSSLAADWILAISEASKAHYLSIFPYFPEERIRVISPCSRFVDENVQGKKSNKIESISSGRFWLSVGTIEPRKNQYHLVEAYARYLAMGGDPMPLVLAGGTGWLMDDFSDYLEELNLSSQVILTGYVSDEELIWLYRHCYGNLYPSLFEGFGLPVLEGMQFGAPTVASNSTSLPEVAGEAAILLSAESIEDWAQTMLRLSSNPDEANALSSAAKEQARRFSWKNSASELLVLYQEAKNSPKVSRA